MARRNGYRPRHLLVKDFTTIIYAHDPMGLTGLGCPTNEYESEALSIVARMTEAPILEVTPEEALDATLNIIRDVFEQWFDTIVNGAKALDLARVLLAAHVASYPVPKPRTAPAATGDDTSPTPSV